jgi:hypothetical protein
MSLPVSVCAAAELIKQMMTGADPDPPVLAVNPNKPKFNMKKMASLLRSQIDLGVLKDFRLWKIQQEQAAEDAAAAADQAAADAAAAGEAVMEAAEPQQQGVPAHQEAEPGAVVPPAHNDAPPAHDPALPAQEVAPLALQDAPPAPDALSAQQDAPPAHETALSANEHPHAAPGMPPASAQAPSATAAANSNSHDAASSSQVSLQPAGSKDSNDSDDGSDTSSKDSCKPAEHDEQQEQQEQQQQHAQQQQALQQNTQQATSRRTEHAGAGGAHSVKGVHNKHSKQRSIKDYFLPAKDGVAKHKARPRSIKDYFLPAKGGVAKHKARPPMAPETAALLVDATAHPAPSTPPAAAPAAPTHFNAAASPQLPFAEQLAMGQQQQEQPDRIAGDFLQQEPADMDVEDCSDAAAADGSAQEPQDQQQRRAASPVQDLLLLQASDDMEVEPTAPAAPAAPQQQQQQQQPERPGDILYESVLQLMHRGILLAAAQASTQPHIVNTSLLQNKAARSQAPTNRVLLAPPAAPQAEQQLDHQEQQQHMPQQQQQQVLLQPLQQAAKRLRPTGSDSQDLPAAKKPCKDPTQDMYGGAYGFDSDGEDDDFSTPQAQHNKASIQQAHNRAPAGSSAVVQQPQLRLQPKASPQQPQPKAATQLSNTQLAQDNPRTQLPPLGAHTEEFDTQQADLQAGAQQADFSEAAEQVLAQPEPDTLQRWDDARACKGEFLRRVRPAALRAKRHARPQQPLPAAPSQQAPRDASPKPAHLHNAIAQPGMQDMGAQPALPDMAARQGMRAVLARQAECDISAQQPLPGPAWHGAAQQAMLEAAQACEQQEEQMIGAGLMLGGERIAALTQAVYYELERLYPNSTPSAEYNAGLAAAVAMAAPAAASSAGAAGMAAGLRYAPGAGRVAAAPAVRWGDDRAGGGRPQSANPALLAELYRVGYERAHINGC